MATEVWLRNPQFCIKEIIEAGHPWLAWDRGYLVKHRIDPSRFGVTYFPTDADYRMLAIGDQGTAEIRPDSTLAAPTAVYPTWEYAEDSADLLEELLANPVGNDSALCGETSIPADERPVLGQEHRIVITRCPDTRSGPGRQLIRLLIDLQAEYTDAIIHIHGLWGFNGLFSHGWRSVDVEPRFVAQKGRVILPSGKEVTYETTRGPLSQWVELLGFKPVELEVARNRCIFNIKSALWASDHFGENIKFKVRGSHVPDITSAVAPAGPTTTLVHGTSKAIEGDKILCDTCSLQLKCKYFRSGGVCSIPDSEPAPLARFFKTRDSGQIIDGLGTLMALQTRRLETGMSNEALDGELDPEVTKIVNSLFTHGVKLAKLVNPALAAAGAPKWNAAVQVNVAGNAAIGTPQSMMAGIVAELEAQGIPRKDITPEMIEKLAIEAGSRDL